ncbi:MAG: beta-galactosidase [Candidatus Saganbacteria bacterium]|nr:beta-galactosidase [Candidatus Saganbacteria bacterium]
MITFGVTFYPELWPEDYVNKAFKDIKASGFDMIRFGENDWGNIELSDDRFDFGWMDKAMSLAESLGLKVLLGIGLSTAPQWLLRKHPEMRPQACDGTLHPKHGALFAWQLDNEPTYPPLDLTDNKDWCHCSASRQAFIAFAKEKYRTIDEANKVWGTKFWGNAFSSFEEISPPPSGFWDAGNPHIFLDWFRFKSESLKNFLQAGKKIVNGLDPIHKVGTNGFTSIPSRIPDHDVLAGILDWYGWDIYPKGTRNNPQSLAQIADYWRSLTDDRGGEFHVTELQGGPNVRWGYQGNVRGEEIRLWTHQMVAHGAGTILYQGWRPHLFGSETAGFGILKADGERGERIEWIEKTIAEARKFEGILSEHKLIPEIAIGYLKNCEIESYQEEARREDIGLMHGLNSIAGAHMITWGKSSPTAFIFERHLETDLKHKVILLTNPYLLKEKHAKVLKKFIYDGGVLITEARFGLKDENAHLYERPLLEYLFEVKHEYTEIIDDVLELKEVNGKAYGFRDVIKAENGVLVRYKDGNPAVVEKKIGKGKILYFTFNLFLSVFKGGNESLSRFVLSHIPEGEVKISGPSDVEVVTWLDTTPLLYIINHSKDARDISAGLPERLIKAHDIAEDKEINIKDKKINIKLLPHEVKVVHLMEK